MADSSSSSTELLIELWPNSTSPSPLRSHYLDFSLSDGDGRFRLGIGKYDGDAGDALEYSRWEYIVFF